MSDRCQFTDEEGVVCDNRPHGPHFKDPDDPEFPVHDYKRPVYTAKALAEDIVGSLRAFWEDFEEGLTTTSAQTGETVAMVRSIDGDIFRINVRKLSVEDS